MAILSNGWYKGSIPFYEITEISITTKGSGIELWDGSEMQDGSILCYRTGTKVIIVCNDNITEIGDRAFFKFLALQRITGLDNVITIGQYAFCYTPKLIFVDLIPSNLTNIGASAFRMSSVEDGLDLSNIPLSIIGDMATRNKRWETSSLTAVKNVAFPKTIYYDVPNSENQGNYPNIQFSTYNGEALSVATAGCVGLSLYHIWNYIHSGTNKQYDNWLQWYNSTINYDGKFAEINDMSGLIYTLCGERLGWTLSESIRVINESQLQTIINRLAIGCPTIITIHSPNFSGMHDIVVIGCNSETHKLAVIDPHVVGTSGIISWLSFEDIFVGGNDDKDRMRTIDFNLPTLAPNTTWFTQGNISLNKTDITEIIIEDKYTSSVNSSVYWDASAEQNGSVTAYIEGTKLILAGNGHGKISLNTDSSNIFNGFENLVSIKNESYLDTSKVTTFERAFQLCTSLQALDASNWNTSNTTNLKAMFQAASKISKLNIGNWNTSNVTNLSYFLNMPTNVYENKALIKLDVSNWNVSKVTDMTAFVSLCRNLEELDVSKWNITACTSIKAFVNGCRNLKELNIGNWNTINCTDMTNMLNNLYNLRKITFGPNFNRDGSSNLFAPNNQYIPGADGKWYDINNNGYTPNDIPNQIFGVYYATPAIAEEDMNQLVLVKKGSLMKTAEAIRTKLESTKGYEPAEFAEAILSS